jgi:aspartyl-tRNA(Asn)/glutamyl-tRNA(Gln) amidotransferase subunit C
LATRFPCRYDQRSSAPFKVAHGAARGYSRLNLSDTIAEAPMSVDIQTVKRVARLARIAVSEEDAARMTGELNTILGFVEQLNEVDVSGVEPMTSVTPMAMRKRADVVTDGNKAADIVANAPATEENFFLVPKVVE